MARSSTLFGQSRRFSDQAPAVSGGGSIPSIQFSTGNARALQDFSRQMFNLSSQFEDQLDQQAEAEAQKEGAIAGMAGNTEERTYQTIRGRAYNKAMLTTFVTTLDTQAMVGAARIRQQYYDDPVEMERALNDYFGGMASEVDKVAPGAGASFRATQTARALSAVEDARDTRFRLTQDEANARLVQHEAALMGQVKENAAFLFSDNPEKSSAASSALSLTIGNYMETYDAVDPVTGRPLFSATDKAKASAFIRDKVMTEATLSWFDQQADPVEAYMKMSDPKFSFKFSATTLSGATGKAGVVGGVLSGKGWSPVAVAGILGHLKAESNFNTTVRGDGGKAFGLAQWHPDRQAQLKRFAARTGGDIKSIETQAAFIDWELRNGDPQSREAGRRLRAATTVDEAVQAFMFFERPAGFSRGNPEGGHNYNGRLRAARGYAAGKGETKTQDVPLRSAMSERAWDALDTEMRQRITFQNTQADRLKREEAARDEAAQKAAETEVSMRIYGSGQEDPLTGEAVKPITQAEVLELQRDGVLSPEKAQGFIKAIATEAPETSDRATYNELQARIYDGEDVQDEILARVDRLTKADVRTLLADNDSANRSGAGSMSTEEKFHYEQLKDLLTPVGMGAGFDSRINERRYEAEREFRRRIKERGETGEKLEDITHDIARRSSVGIADMANGDMAALPLPRFSVRPQGTTARRIDMAASKKSLRDALSQNRITAAEAAEQAELLRRWDEAQTLFDQAQEEITRKRK